MEIKLTRDNFEKVISENKTVLIDFWASWCGPCKMIAPHVEKLSEELSDVAVCKANVDEEGELAASFGINSIPTLVLIKDGEEADRIIGYREYDALKSFVTD
jgi:thioredoxin 1